MREVELVANGDSMEERAASDLARDRAAAGVEVTPGAEPTPVELEPDGGAAPAPWAPPMVDPGNIALVAIAKRLEAQDAQLAALAEALPRIEAALLQLAGLSDVATQVAEAVKAEGLPGLLKLLMAAARS